MNTDNSNILKANNEIDSCESKINTGYDLVKDTGYDLARLDTDRTSRTGFPEVIFCQNKDDNHLLSIYKEMVAKSGSAFGTRATLHQYEIIKNSIPEASYDSVSRILKITADKKEQCPMEAGIHKASSYIAVVTAGTADIPVAEEAAQTAEYFGSKVERIYDVGVSGIHRLLAQTDRIQKASCVIAVAGMEGALASVIGGLVSNPVIAVPTSVGYGANFEGLSALLTMINSCANGVTVVNIDNGYGAGYSACQIDRLYRAEPK